MKLPAPFRPRRPHPNRRATLRDLYVHGLVSVFRQHSILRIWEPLRETRGASRQESRG